MVVCEYKQIYIANIFLPDFMRHKGIGKKLIYKILMISEDVHYRLDKTTIDEVELFVFVMKKKVSCVELKEYYESFEKGERGN